MRANPLLLCPPMLLEYARQRDYASNPLDLNGHYFLGELGYQHGDYLAKASYDADEFAVDTDKFWVQLQYRY